MGDHEAMTTEQLRQLAEKSYLGEDAPLVLKAADEIERLPKIVAAAQEVRNYRGDNQFTRNALVGNLLEVILD